MPKHTNAACRISPDSSALPDGMNGKELAQRFLEENPKLKVIFLSGYSSEIAGKGFPLEEGVNFLAKPFETEKFAKAIRSRLNGV